MISPDTQPLHREKPQKRTLERLPDVRAVLTVVAVALYGVLRIAYGRFYAPFGLSPEDLGLGYLELLTQAAISAVVLLTLYGLLLWLTVGIYALLMYTDTRGAELEKFRARVLKRRPQASSGTAVMATIAMTFYAALLFGIALSYVLLTFVALFSWLNGTFSLPSGLLIVPIVLLVVVGAIRGTRRIKRQLAGDLSLNDHQEVSWWRATLIIPPIVAALLATAVFAFTLVSAANHHAKRAKDGRATNYTVFGTQLTSWGAEAARLSWTTDNVDSALRPLARTCVMYLGQTGGNVIVYVPFAGGPRGSRVPVGTFRIPAGSVAVRVLPQGRCVRKTPYPVLRPT